MAGKREICTPPALGHPPPYELKLNQRKHKHNIFTLSWNQPAIICYFIFEKWITYTLQQYYYYPKDSNVNVHFKIKVLKYTHSKLM